MSRERLVLAFGGGKGGVGKSLVCSAVATALAQRGLSVVALDADLGAANLHTLLGLVHPSATLDDFFSGRISRLDEICLPTDIDGLRVISGAAAILRAANPRRRERERLLTAFFELDADVLLFDLGAGTQENTLDLFNLAGEGLIVTGTEPTAIQNAYAFIKSALFRGLTELFRGEPEAGALVERAVLARGPDRIESVERLLSALDERSPAWAERAAARIAGMQIRLIVNQAAPRDGRRVLGAIGVVCQRYLGLHLPLLGALPPDATVGRAVHRMAPVMLEDPESPFALAVNALVTALLGDASKTRIDDILARFESDPPPADEFAPRNDERPDSLGKALRAAGVAQGRSSRADDARSTGGAHPTAPVDESAPAAVQATDAEAEPDVAPAPTATLTIDGDAAAEAPEIQTVDAEPEPEAAAAPESAAESAPTAARAVDAEPEPEAKIAPTTATAEAEPECEPVSEPDMESAPTAARAVDAEPEPGAKAAPTTPAAEAEPDTERASASARAAAFQAEDTQATDSEPEPEAASAPTAALPAVDAEPAPDTEAVPTVDAEPEPEAADAMAELEAASAPTAALPAVDAEPAPEVIPGRAADLESEAEATPARAAEVESEPVRATDAEPEPAWAADLEPEPEAVSEPEAESAPASAQASDVMAEPEMVFAPTAALPAVHAEPEPEAASAPATALQAVSAEPGPHAVAVPTVDAEPEPAWAADPEPEPEAVSEPEAESAPASVPETVSAPTVALPAVDMEPEPEAASAPTAALPAVDMEPEPEAAPAPTAALPAVDMEPEPEAAPVQAAVPAAVIEPEPEAAPVQAAVPAAVIEPEPEAVDPILGLSGESGPWSLAPEGEASTAPEPPVAPDPTRENNVPWGTNEVARDDSGDATPAGGAAPDEIAFGDSPLPIPAQAPGPLTAKRSAFALIERAVAATPSGTLAAASDVLDAPTNRLEPRASVPPDADGLTFDPETFSVTLDGLVDAPDEVSALPSTTGRSTGSVDRSLRAAGFPPVPEFDDLRSPFPVVTDGTIAHAEDWLAGFSLDALVPEAEPEPTRTPATPEPIAVPSASVAPVPAAMFGVVGEDAAVESADPPRSSAPSTAQADPAVDVFDKTDEWTRWGTLAAELRAEPERDEAEERTPAMAPVPGAASTDAVPTAVAGASLDWPAFGEEAATDGVRPTSPPRAPMPVMRPTLPALPRIRTTASGASEGGSQPALPGLTPGLAAALAREVAAESMSAREPAWAEDDDPWRSAELASDHREPSVAAPQDARTERAHFGIGFDQAVSSPDGWVQVVTNDLAPLRAAVRQIVLHGGKTMHVLEQTYAETTPFAIAQRVERTHAELVARVERGGLAAIRAGE